MQKLGSAILAMMPWMIITVLLGAALFVKPQPVGQTVSPPVREARDRFYGITVAEPGHIWLAGNDGKIVVSTDAGQNWLAQTSSTDKHLQDISAWSSTRAVAIGNDGVVLVTADGGLLWQEVKVPRSDVFNKLMRVVTLPNGRALAVGAMGSILMSDDFGVHWQRMRDEEDVAWNGIGISDDILWVVGEFGRLVKSIDHGVTWLDVPSPVDSSLTGIAFRDSMNGVVVGLDGVVLTTRDGGLSWIVENKVTEEHLFDVVGDESGWVAVGNKNMVLTSDVLTSDVSTSDGTSMSWKAKRLSDRDLAWHTKIEYSDKKFYLAGASVGVLDADQWVKF